MANGNPIISFYLMAITGEPLQKKTRHLLTYKGSVIYYFTW